MFNTRNVIRLISTTNELTTGRIGIRKNKRYPIASKRNNSNFKSFDRQTNIADDIKFNVLSDLFVQENKSYLDASFIFNVDPIIDDKVNDGIRDKEIEKLLDLNNVYFGLPVSVICDSVSIIDRFISKVKVKPKYMPCLAAACLHLVATSKGHEKMFLTCDNLANLHRCGASGQDLERMQQIIDKKLQNSMPSVTILDFIRVIDPQAVNDYKFVRILEVALMKFSICWHRPSRVASACLLVYYKQNQAVQQITLFQTFCDFIKEDWELIKCLSIMIAEHYSNIHSKKSIESSRNHLFWVISRKSLSNFQTASPPLLETIFEENDDCFNLSN